MKTGGGLNYCTGPMGAGKTFYAVARVLLPAMLEGKYAVTNVELKPGWSLDVARRIARTRSHRRKLEIAARLESLYVFETDLAEAMRYRVPGSGEGRAVFVWDEGHNDLNNRSWRDDGRAQLLEWATQLRKLGFVGYLLTQSLDNTDAQLRRICNFAIRLQNQREHTRALGLRITPWPLFLAAWFPAHIPIRSSSQLQPVRVERYFLGWQRNLYDSWGLYHGLAGEDVEGVIELPAGGWAPHLRALVEPLPAPAPEPPRRRDGRAAA